MVFRYYIRPTLCAFFSHPPSCFVSEPRDDGDDADADDGIVVNFNRVTFCCELNAVDAVWVLLPARRDTHG